MEDTVLVAKKRELGTNIFFEVFFCSTDKNVRNNADFT